jgi:tetratricopeptide (TPR) repeat protein
MTSSKRRREQKPGGEPPRRTVHIITVCVILAAATFAVYWPALKCDFVDLDDPEYFSENPQVLAGLTWKGIEWSFSSSHAGFWIPLTWISFMTDVALFGTGARGPHLTNVLLHMANAVLLFLLLRRITRTEVPAAIVAALFALHPLRVESVAWVTERKDVLSTFFALLALWAYASSVTPEDRGAVQRRVKQEATHSPGKTRRSKLICFLSLMLFMASLMSKPVLVTFPFMLLLLDYWPLGRFAHPRTTAEAVASSLPSFLRIWLRLVLEKLGFFLLAAVFALITFLAHSKEKAVTSLAGLSLTDRISNAFISYARYLGKTIWPVDLACFYPHPRHWPTIQVLLAVILFAAVCFAALRFGGKRPFLVVGWLWFLLILIPNLGLIQAGAQSMADRFTYVPLIGVFVALVWGARDLLGRWQPSRVLTTATIVLTGLVLAGCAARTVDQLHYWHNSEIINRHALEVTKDNYVAENNLGCILADKGRVEEAIAYFHAAIRSNPTFAEAFFNLGRALVTNGRIDQAIESLQQAVRLRPDHAKARTALGDALAKRGRTEEAIVQFRESVRCEPSDARTRTNLAEALAAKGQLAEAIQQYTESLRLEPGQVEVHNNLAWILATARNDGIRNGAEAVRLARRAAEMSGDKNPVILDTLAAAYAEAGGFQDAVQTAQKAAQLAQQSGQPDLLQQIQTRLKLYAEHRPFRVQ